MSKKGIEVDGDIKMCFKSKQDMLAYFNSITPYVFDLARPSDRLKLAKLWGVKEKKRSA